MTDREPRGAHETPAGGQAGRTGLYQVDTSLYTHARAWWDTYIVPQDEMLRTFNMGIGMILVVPAKKFKKVQTILERCGEKGYTIGRVVKGEKRVTYQ